MRNKLTTLFFALIVCTTTLFAQPEPCVNPAMTSTCAQACIICDIDGFTGINNSNVQGQAPPGFCTTEVHHMQWIAFIAGTPNLTLSVQVFNCQQNNGLEIGIYRSLNCQNFTLVSNCDTDVENNSTGIFTNTVPLEVGQYYYLVMDGSAGDICNYTVHVLEGSTEVSPLSTTDPIMGPDGGCPDINSQYTTDTVSGATIYRWTLNNAPIGNNSPAVTIDWDAPGTYQLCVTASNACDEATPSCKTIVINEIPPTIIEQSICEGDCFAIADTFLCEPGSFEFHYPVAYGCDSLVIVTLTENPVVETDISLLICAGDSISIGNTYFSLPGQYDEALTSINGCDSIIHLTLDNIICEIQGNISPTPVQCFGESSGAITFSVTNGTPPFTYSWERTNGAPNGSGPLPNTNQPQTVSGLLPGVYLVTIADAFGNDVILITEVTEPAPLSLSFASSDYNGVNVSCNGGSDGTLAVSAQGGIQPYSFAWSSGDTQPQLSGLSAGNYTVSITDARGCKLEGSTTLTEPPALDLQATFTNPNCDGPATGFIQVNSSTGGTPPYQYDLNNLGYTDSLLYTGLIEGSYTLSIKDANGCITTQENDLVAALIPSVEAGEDQFLPLAESLDLNVITNLTPAAISWEQDPGLSCYDCLNPVASPYNTTTYTVSITSADNCLRSDSLTIHVLKFRDVFIPNAFSPNLDGINDVFNVFGGPEVRNVLSFKVFSRWGELIFDQRNISANSSSQGWDGTFKGKPMPEGVYVYLIEIDFVDDETFTFEGSVGLIR